MVGLIIAAARGIAVDPSGTPALPRSGTFTLTMDGAPWHCTATGGSTLDCTYRPATQAPP